MLHLTGSMLHFTGKANFAEMFNSPKAYGFCPSMLPVKCKMLNGATESTSPKYLSSFSNNSGRLHKVGLFKNNVAGLRRLKGSGSC